MHWATEIVSAEKPQCSLQSQPNSYENQNNVQRRLYKDVGHKINFSSGEVVICDMEMREKLSHVIWSLKSLCPDNCWFSGDVQRGHERANPKRATSCVHNFYLLRLKDWVRDRAGCQTSCPDALCCWSGTCKTDPELCICTFLLFLIKTDLWV